MISTKTGCFNDAPIGEVAKSVGYADALYFSRIFKKQFGVTPGEFRMAPFLSKIGFAKLASAKRVTQNQRRIGGVTMKRLLGLMVSIVFLASMAAGCGGATEPSSSSASNGTLPVQEGKNDQETAKWPRTYVDALGRETVLEKKPERVALLFFRNFEQLFLLDESPVAATDLNVLDEWEFLAPYKDRDIADIGSIANPNVEKLLEIDPDLIIVVANRYESYGGKLEQIAPVIVVDSNENNWQGALREYGKIFGKEQKAEDEIARMEALIADSQEKLTADRDKRGRDFLGGAGSDEPRLHVCSGYNRLLQKCAELSKKSGRQCCMEFS